MDRQVEIYSPNDVWQKDKTTQYLKQICIDTQRRLDHDDHPQAMDMSAIDHLVDDVWWASKNDSRRRESVNFVTVDQEGIFRFFDEPVMGLVGRLDADLAMTRYNELKSKYKLHNNGILIHSHPNDYPEEYSAFSIDDLYMSIQSSAILSCSIISQSRYNLALFPGKDIKGFNEVLGYTPSQEEFVKKVYESGGWKYEIDSAGHEQAKPVGANYMTTYEMNKMIAKTYNMVLYKGEAVGWMRKEKL